MLERHFGGDRQSGVPFTTTERRWYGLTTSNQTIEPLTNHDIQILKRDTSLFLSQPPRERAVPRESHKAARLWGGRYDRKSGILYAGKQWPPAEGVAVETHGGCGVRKSTRRTQPPTRGHVSFANHPTHTTTYNVLYTFFRMYIRSHACFIQNKRKGDTSTSNR